MKRTAICCALLFSYACDDGGSEVVPTEDAEADVGVLDGSVDTDALDEDAGPDAARPEPDLGAPSGCEACARVVSCTAEVCSGEDAADAEQVDTICQKVCAELGAFEAVVTGAETCADVVAFMEQTAPEDFGGLCTRDPSAPPMLPECEVFGSKIAECILARCPAGEPLREHLVGAYTHVCNFEVSMGANPADLANLANERASCDEGFLEMIVTQQIEGDGEGNQGMAQFCEEGPLVPIEACEAACDNVRPCIGPEDDNVILRDAHRCVHLCASLPNPPAQAWTCAAEQMTCEQVFMCFGGGGNQPDPVPGCEFYGSRGAACAAEVCPGIEGVSETLGLLLGGSCNEQVAAGQLREEQVGALNAETPCDDRLIQALVGYLTTPNPNNPEQGPLAAACEAPLNPPELCSEACSGIQPCAPAQGDVAFLSNPQFCEYVCALSADVPEGVWTCIRDADECPARMACVGQ